MFRWRANNNVAYEDAAWYSRQLGFQIVLCGKRLLRISLSQHVKAKAMCKLSPVDCGV
jgi:hypothetical protein